MLQIKLIGELEALKTGIELVAEAFKFEQNDKGIPVQVIKASESEETLIEYDGKQGMIQYTTISSFFRSLNLWLYNYQKFGQFSHKETPQFDKTGVMVDASRNAVLKTSGMKELLIEMAKLGLNLAMLYTEETYEVKAYPYFGYLRGRYTKAELQEMDDDAASLGIEMVPCIQTLGHLYLALKYEYANTIKDTSDIVLVGDSKTYEFLNNIIRAASEPFRSNRIHIGMDEAWGLGTGAYQAKNGIRDNFDIMNEHLEEVVKITETLGLEPMMWSDMFYRFGSKTHDYYDLESDIPQKVIDEIPNVDMVYWDYYHEDEAIYDTLISKHQAMNKKVIFAGGIWTWNGIAPNYGKSFESTKAGLSSCKRHGIREVFATMWGDDGGETPVLSALPGLQLFADLSYREKLDEKQMHEEFEYNTGYAFDAFYQLNALDETPGVLENNLNSSATSKVLLWQDPLLGLFDKTVEGLELNEHYRQLAEQLKVTAEQPGTYQTMFAFYHQLAKTLSLKAEFGLKLKQAYDSGNKDSLSENLEAAQDLLERLEDLRRTHQKVWLQYNKPFGWEVLDIRYGGAIMRLKTTIDRVSQYVAGELKELEELAEEKLPFSNPYDLGEGTHGRGLYKDMVTAGKLSGV